MSEEKEAPAPAEKYNLVVSRLDHPTTLSYDGEAMVCPPRGRLKIKNSKLLGALPKGVQLLSK